MIEAFPLAPSSLIELQVELHLTEPYRIGAAHVGATAIVTSPDGRVENLTLVLDGLPEPSEIAASEGLAILRGESSDPARLLRSIGRRLFRALFGGPLRRAYAQAIDRAAASGSFVALRIVTRDAALLVQPWELLVDDELRRSSEFLALAGWSLVRGLPGTVPARPLPRPDRLRVLVLSADMPFPVERDFEVLQEIVASNRAVNITVEGVKVRTAGEVFSVLAENEADVIHYAGVGEWSFQPIGDTRRPESPLLQLGGSERISADDLARILQERVKPQLVVLNGAFTDRAAEVLAASVPSVVGLSGQVIGDACMQFAEGLYRAIATGSTARAAVVAGRMHVQYRFPQDRYWSAPVQYDSGDVGLLSSPGATQGTVLTEPEATEDESMSLLLEQKTMAERNLEVLREKLSASSRTPPATLIRQQQELVEQIKQFEDKLEERS